MTYNREPREFEEKVIQIKRVSKKTKGGNRISFTAMVVVGDRKGRVGVGLGKAPNVRAAILKGIVRGKRCLVKVPMVKTTIRHRVIFKKGAAKVLLKPAPPGSGVIAGASVRAVVEAAGIQDISAKILGSRNRANNVYVTIEALKSLKQRNIKTLKH